MANQIQIMIDQSSNSLPHVRAGKIRAYAVTAKQRNAAAPDIPTTAEAGFPGIEVAIWHGLWAPKGTPPEIINKLNAAAIVALKDPEVRRRLEDLGQDIPTPEQMQPAAFAAYQKAEFAKWKPIIDKAGVKIE
jgi:tripartite-type tricarboxylate transporter receptor subunit TctC